MSSIARASTVVSATKSVKLKAVDYQILESDYCIIVNSSSVTATLPNPTTIAGNEYVIKSRASLPVYVSPYAAETIDGDSGSFTLYADESINVITDGTNWFII